MDDDDEEDDEGAEPHPAGSVTDGADDTGDEIDDGDV